jgi:hypothetical protein
MNGHATVPLLGPGSTPPRVWVAILSFALVFLVFIIDWILPDPVIADLAYQAPVVFAVLKGTQRLTMLTLLLGCVGIFLGWYVDLANAGFVFSEVRIANRLLSLVSLLIVGALALQLARNAKRAELVEAERALARELAVTSALDRVMAASSPEAAIRAIAAEIPALLETKVAVWCSAGPDGARWEALDGVGQATPLSKVKPSSGFDALMERLGSQRTVQVVNAAESIDYLTGKAQGGECALAIPLPVAGDLEAIVFAAIEGDRVDARTLAVAGNFAHFAGTAVHRARFHENLERH